MKDKEKVEVKVSELFDEIKYLKECINKAYTEREELRDDLNKLYSENRALRARLLTNHESYTGRRHLF